MQTINGKYLAQFASDKPQIWFDLVGVTVEHKECGPGKILSVKPRPNNEDPLIKIQYDNETEPVSVVPYNFQSGNFSLLVDEDLAKRVNEATEQRQDQDHYLSEFHKLFKEPCKTLAELFKGIDKKSPFGPILDKLEAHEEWLKEKAEKDFLSAAIHLRKYRDSHDQWLLVNTCSSLRKAGLPNVALSFIDNFSLTKSISDSTILGALLTTRGGALRDLDDLEAAKESAREAIRVSPDYFHPHNLLGAIYLQEGNIEKGKEHFAEAEKLGLTPGLKKTEIQDALRRATPEVRSKIKHLVSGE